MTKLSRKEKLLFALPLLPLAALGLTQVRVNPTLSLQNVRITDIPRTDSRFPYGNKEIQIISRLYTWSPRYKLNRLTAAVRHPGTLTGYLIDERGEKLDWSKVGKYGNLNGGRIRFISMDNGDQRLWCGFPLTTVHIPKSAGTVTFKGEIKYRDIQPLQVSFVVRRRKK